MGGMETLHLSLGEQQAELPITSGTVSAKDLKSITTSEGPLATYDPGLLNTAAVKSGVSFIDGDAGILEYRGYPIEQLAEKSTFLEVAYLLLKGELPTSAELEDWTEEVNRHRLVHENVKQVVDSLRYDAHPMAKMMAATSSLHTFYPDSRVIDCPGARARNIVRLLGKMPTIAAWAYRHSLGRHFVYPDDSLGYVPNFLEMMFSQNETRHQKDERLTRAVEVLFILHADHEQNCSANAVRSVASAGNGPYTSCTAGIAALYGPLHGGANEAVLRMLREIGSVDRVPEFMEGAKTGKGRLMGFGHRVYKNYDPRARIIKAAANDVFEVTGVNPLLEIALELERIALDDEYFVSRKLYPNVDFYSGLIYEALGLPPEMFTVMFAVPRTAGWLAQWEEQVTDPEQKIVRPRQIYTGHRGRDYRAVDER
ncbi:MAG TPA: citrate synthase [Actinomycetales bacterium]|nr:citrate synthase [Actinomycetales bacterium]